MGNTEIAELMMLRQAAELYNCAEILRDAIEGDEHDQFSADYIDGERNMVRYAAKELKTKIEELLECFGIEEDETFEQFMEIADRARELGVE